MRRRIAYLFYYIICKLATKNFRLFEKNSLYNEGNYGIISFAVAKEIRARSSAGRAFGSHPYGRTSHGSGPFPISSPIFRTFPSKMNILKIRFSQLFSMKNGQYGLVAQLGAQRVRFSATSTISYCFILLFRFWNC